MKTAVSFFRKVTLSSNVVRHTFYLPESREPPEVPPLWVLTPHSIPEEATLLE